MKKTIPTLILAGFALNMATAPTNSAKSYSPFGSYKVCFHNNEEYIQIGSSQLCELPHAQIGNSPAKHAGQNPHDCVIHEVIIEGELD